MTTKEIHQLFDVNYDKANVITAYPSLLSEEKDVWLNNAYVMWINQRFTGANARTVGFEGDTKRIADLRGLLKTTNISTFTTNGFTPNELIFTLEPSIKNQYYLYVESAIKFNNDGIVRQVLPIQHASINAFKVTSINNPWIPKPVLVEEAGVFVIYYDKIEVPTVTTANLQLRYIKRPAVFNYYSSPDAEFELNDEVVKEIITNAVFLALENIESNRVSTTGSITTIQE